MRLRAWYLRPPPPTLAGTILWWELRRIPYNVVVLSNAFVSLCLTSWFISHFVVLRPGEDAFEPMMLVLSPIAMNVCYTLGEWCVLTQLVFDDPQFTPTGALRAGTIFSIWVVWLPTLLWCLKAAVIIMGRL